jgi:hypothetical protein
MFLLENDDCGILTLFKKWLLACGRKERLRIYNYDEADEEYEGNQ